MPDTIATPDGVTFRPNLLATTSFDGSIATTYKRTVTITVCDNTRELWLPVHCLSCPGGNKRGRGRLLRSDQEVAQQWSTWRCPPVLSGCSHRWPGWPVLWAGQTALERDCTDVSSARLWGGHVPVRVGTRPG